MPDGVRDPRRFTGSHTLQGGGGGGRGAHHNFVGRPVHHTGRIQTRHPGPGALAVAVHATRGVDVGCGGLSVGMPTTKVQRLVGVVLQDGVGKGNFHLQGQGTGLGQLFCHVGKALAPRCLAMGFLAGRFLQ